MNGGLDKSGRTDNNERNELKPVAKLFQWRVLITIANDVYTTKYVKNFGGKDLDHDLTCRLSSSSILGIVMTNMWFTLSF